MWDPERDFAYAKIPNIKGSQHNNRTGVPSKYIQTLCAISPSNSLRSGSLLLMVATADGDFFMFSADENNGGECELLKQYTLMDPVEEEN
jgi:autophagy-related protein 18